MDAEGAEGRAAQNENMLFKISKDFKVDLEGRGGWRKKG